MKSRWLKQEKEKQRIAYENAMSHLRAELTKLKIYDKKQITGLCKYIEEIIHSGVLNIFFLQALMRISDVSIYNLWKENPSTLTDTYEVCKPLINNLPHITENYDMYLDSTPKHYKGDIIITDPSYFISNEDLNSDILNKNKFKPIPSLIMHNTLYGDWSCVTYDINSHSTLGNFCADTGMVAVAKLKDVRKYNPSFDYHISRPWTTTIIENFDGEVYFEIKRRRQTDGWVYSLYVVGNGVNFKTGKPIQFRTKQVGF